MVGVSVSAEGVALCRLAPSEDTYQLSHCVYEGISSHRDIPDALSRLVKQNGLHDLPCVLSLSYGDYKLLRTDAPAVEPQELRDAVRWKIQDQIEWDADDTIIDVYPLPESRQPGRPKTVNVVAAQRSLLQERVAWLKQSGLSLHSITIPELALTAYVPLMPENQSGLLMLHHAGETGVLLAAKQDWMYLSRHVRLNQAGYSLHAEDADTAAQEALVLEIQRSLDYYESYFAESPINDLVITPVAHSGDDAKLLSGINRQLSIQARTLDMTAVFETARPIEDQLQSRCLTAAGAALSELRA